DETAGIEAPRFAGRERPLALTAAETVFEIGRKALARMVMNLRFRFGGRDEAREDAALGAEIGGKGRIEASGDDLAGDFGQAESPPRFHPIRRQIDQAAPATGGRGGQSP